MGMDDFDRASVEFEAALDLGGGEQDETGIRLQLARALLGLKRKEDAIYHLERVLEIDSDNAEARRLLERARGN